MPADKLGRYLTSQLFLDRANAAIAKSVRDLEAHGIKPAGTNPPKPAGTKPPEPEEKSLNK
jgi:hypothetical protein